MGLVQVATNTVTSAVAQVDLVGINSDDVYVVCASGITTDTLGQFYKRVLVSSSPDTTSNYDRANMIIRADTTFNKLASQNADHWETQITGFNASNNGLNFVYYLYNFNNSSEYSFITFDGVNVGHSALSSGGAGGGVHTVTQSCNGIRFYHSAGNITSGTFTLYKVV